MERDYEKLIENLRGDFPGEYVKDAANAIEELLHFNNWAHDYFSDMPYDPRDDYVAL